MAKIVEKGKVGRPKLADEELIKDSWYKIAASFSIVFVLVICGVGVLTSRTPFQIMTFQNPNKIKASVVNVEENKGVEIVRVISSKASETRKISPNGTVTRVVPVR